VYDNQGKQLSEYHNGVEKGWRLPAYVEWYNVDNIGNWTNWNWPWNSGLKLHAAGGLDENDGLFYDRGSSGF
jgi:hypothetical protein